MGVLSAQPRTLHSFSMFFRGSRLGCSADLTGATTPPRAAMVTTLHGSGGLAGAFGFTVGRWSWMLAFIDNRGSLQFTMCPADSLRGLELGRRGVRELSPKYETVELCS
ncbi:hypothetical protein BHE90_014583 [Fusarium euwallaceae]|uniref:Uncharacterized protein n=3 Tax=Fusarium solani species complex TaxID=232080 RepID=A0A428SE09_9HYPO|nr:hypothetical protein CEP52_015333 [Fusarium oligoseptatum]RSL93200.1 hypothetical protein CDV31_014826 [Fusarium ambrosium]RTE71020.1 hypothetical protein BHE90_014583 [Fusarium euwallaceae]